MIDLYKKYKLKPNASCRSLFKKLERILRREIKDGELSELTLRAFVILSNSTLRKYNDRALQNESLYRRLKRTVDKESELYVLDLLKNHHIFSEKVFLHDNAAKIVHRAMGLDFLLQRISYRSFHSKQKREIRGGGLNAFGAHTLLYYAVPLFLSIYDLEYLWTFLPVLAIMLFVEYWNVKHEYYFHKRKMA